ncbi:porin [Marinobacterium rhizophilum]|uniref:porin n=1 Tax=Marinobacterium rhizophilum TaxID=420402 RepID=UPI000367D6EA|nr:porin [Marinobacterium rhizophilum]
MKKSLIALAIAGAMTAPIVAQADATLYGGVETRLKFIEDHDADLFVDKAEMGVKGSSDLENLDGVKATYQIEFRIDANGNDDSALANTINNSNSSGVQMRKANVGLVGDFGIVQIGRQNNLGNAVKKADVFMSQSAGYLANDRFGNAVYYVTPKMAGFEAYAGLILDGQQDDNEEDVDAWQLGFNYGLMGLDLSAAYTEVDSNYLDGADDAELWGVGAAYAIGDFTLAATYENQEVGDVEDETAVLAALYTIGNTTLKAGYAETWVDNSHEGSDGLSNTGDNDYAGYTVQAAYALGKKATVKAEWNTQDYDGDRFEDTDTVTLSYAVAF